MYSMSNVRVASQTLQTFMNLKWRWVSMHIPFLYDKGAAGLQNRWIYRPRLSSPIFGVALRQTDERA